ncbi:hypothetical protein EDB84DRAFT_1499234 [Lactarius hengduanensis]|nr:hypothetical protein EDB84DRAFT_1499234 [Lactarius hengduanensis]
MPRYGPYYHPFAILPSANAIADLSMPSATHAPCADCPSDAMISLIPRLAPLATPSLAMPHDGRPTPTLCVYMHAPIFPTELAERPAGVRKNGSFRTRDANHTTPQIPPVKANTAIHLSRFPSICVRRPMGEMAEQLGSRRQLPLHCERS